MTQLDVSTVMKILCSAIFVVGGLAHFVIPATYVNMMPPYIPWHRAAVFVSGVLEAGLGVLLLIPATSSLAAWALLVVLVAIFPANVHMAQHPELWPNAKPPLLWARLPLQGVLLWWVYQYT